MAQFGEDGGDDQGFDVGSALDDLINTSTGAPAGTPVNPDMLVNRLARKVGASVKARSAAPPQPGAAVAPGSPPAAPPAADDLSSFGLNPDDLAGEADQPPRPQGVDLSSFGAPADSMAPEAAAKKPEKGPGVLGSIGRGLARGAPEGLGEAMQGAAIFHPGAQAPDALTGLIGELRNVPNMTQAERAALMARAVRAGKEPSIGAISTPFNAALQRIAAGADPEQEISALTEGYSNRAKKGLQNPSARELYDAGKSVKDWAEKTFPATDKEKESIPYQVAHGVSAMGPYVAAGIINPIFGLGLGAAGMGLQVGASTFEDAKNKGATDEQATQAAGWGAAVGGALGVLPLGMVLKPVSQSSPGMKAWLTAKLVQAGQSGATFATVGEAQEYLLKQVAKEFYDKEAGYSPDAHRTIVSLLTGAVLGPLHQLRKDAKNTPSSGGADEPPSISGPFSPGGGPDFRRSSPEDISEFIRKAKESAPKDGAEDTAKEKKKSSYTGPDPATMSDAELMAAFDAARASHDGARMEDILRSSGLSDERIAAMSEMDKIYATIRATKEGYAGKEGPDGSTAEPGRSKTEDVEREALKRRGLTDEQIDAMAPADRRKAFQDAMSGVEEPKQAGAAKDDNPNGLRAMGSGLANAMTEGLVDRYWSRAKAGYDHDLGQKDALLQAAKIVREAGGLQTRDEFKAFMQDYGRIDSGDGFQSSMRAIVSKYMPKPSGDGSRNNPIVPRTADDVAKITDAVTEPKSPQQAEAENYKHGHVEMEHLGLSGKNGISVETGKGQRRSGVDEDGNDWHVENMPVPYGRIKGTKSSDGQPLDIFIGPNPLSKNIFVIQQNRPRGGGFDEHKILAGFDTQQDALSAYKLSYNDGGGDRIGPIVTMDRDKFWSWVESGGALHPFDSDRSSIGDKPETTSDHHAQIDAVLGEDSSRVLPADAARAAEILAENPGMDPGTAFENAVVEGAVEQKFLTHQEAVEAYGKDVESILEPEREGAPVGGGDVEQKGAAPVEVGSGGAKETGVVPGGGEDRARSGTEGQGDQKSGDTAAKDAKSGADETGPRSAVDATSGDQNAENKPAAENTDAAGVSGDERGKPVIYTGSVWKTKSGRETTPAPKIDAATDRKTKRSLFLLDQWLLENARAEVNGNDYQETLLKKLDPKKFSQSDRDTVNLLLFGDENGPRQSDEVKNQETKFFKHESDNTLGLGIDNPTRDQMIVALEEENKKFSNVDGTPKHPNEKINAYILGLNKEIIRQLRDGEQYDKDKSIREGKHGAGTRIQPGAGEPEQVTVEPVKKTGGAADASDETAAIDEAMSRASLSDTFAKHLADGGTFKGILHARKLAKETGHDTDPKAVEEAMEAAVVKVARGIVSGDEAPAEKFANLVDLYGRQPKLSTRTSTSVRDQAYSTPVPLAYLASRLAGIDRNSSVYEPAAGNGALLIEANPKNVVANEINPDRRKSLEDSGFNTTSNDGANPTQARAIAGADPVDVVIANPPFGAVNEGGKSKSFDLTWVRPGYETTEIDHAMAFAALKAMRDDGRAVLLIGGVSKMKASPEARSNAYHSQSKRLFYKALYDDYNVVDHFTVDGDLYARQGAGWPVDVVVIDGRSPSKRRLPAVDVPNVFSTWEELGGLLDGNADGRSPAGEAVGASDGGRGGLDRSGQPNRRMDERRGAVGVEPEPREPGGMGEKPRGDRGPELAGNDGEGGRGEHPVGGDGNRSGEQAPSERRPSGLDDFDALFDAALDSVYGKDQPSEPAPAGTSGTRSTAGGGGARVQRKRSGGGAERDARTDAEVSKDTAKAAAESADAAFEGLYKLFGGDKLSSGFTFDEQTWAKAKPMFTKAAEKFAEFRKNMGELLRRMVDHMSKTLGWPREVQNRMRPYFKRFAEELTSGEIRLGEEDAPKAGEPKAEAKKPAEGGGADGVHQIEYRPRSKSNGLDTLAPKNMRDAMEQSLARLERDVGSIDAFVAKELGYDNDAAGNMFDAFGAEQIDAIALAINALKKNKGFIIGDQTGIGKGRVNAAIIRWAIKNGHTPIFVTHKPNLYQDMYRDMTAIGMNDGSFLDGPVRILATNSGPDIELGGGHSIKTGNTKSHGELLSSFIDGSKKLEDSFDVVFTTYDQLNAVDKKDTIRRNFIWSIAPKSILILDESHNAGGTQSERGKKQGDADSRAEYTRKIIDRARGAFYSSATYAKRPDVMDLYSKTNISLAVSDKKLLAQTIESGGIPLQQVVAAMLAKDGQYVRRERSFNGITYDTPIISVDRSSYDAMSYSLADINAFSMFVKSVAEKISEDIKGAGDALGYDNATGGAGASSTNFTSITHNVIKQMLLAIKADAAADMAIEHIKQGRKPVITVSGTMESFLSDYSANLGIETGGKISSDFAIVLQKYLDRTRTILIKKPFEDDKKKKVERRYLTDDELGPIGVGLYNSARVGIETLKIGHLPISPIDYIIGKIEGAGYSVGEITGRTLRVDYSGESPILSTRPGKDKTPGGRNATLKRFNTRPENGGSHAILLNQAGSTGLSAHASKEFDDRSPRTMLIVQPEDNIDTHMQLLGRINRTGQVVLPSFYQLTADIPAEKRPAANLAKKMASLNANTTASRTSAVTSKDAPDFMNKYGDIVAFNWATDNPDINRRLGNPIDLSGGEKKIDGAMRSITGRLPLLPLAKQENAYSELESGYKELLSQVEAAGENALEAKLLDLKAKPIEQTEVVAGDLSNSSQFTKSVNIVKANVARLGKPYSPKEVAQLIADNVGMKVPEGADVTEFIRKADVDHNSDIGRALIKQHENTRDEVFNAQKAYVRSVVDEIETDTKRHSENVRLAENLSRWTDAYDLVRPGSRVVLKGAQGNITGFVIGVSKKGDTKNPIALGSWKAVIAVADSSRRIEIPFRNIFKEGRSDESSSTDIEIQRTQPWYEDHAKTVGNFESMQREVREDRYIAVGNMLAAFAWTGNKGSIINFTDANGKIHQGILMARNFDLAKKMKDAGVLLKSASEVKSRIDSDGSIVSSGEGNLEISKDGRYSDSYSIYVDKSKRTGGKYYLDKGLTDITGDFISRSGKMHSQVYDDKIVPAINRMMQIGAKFVVESKAGAPKPRPMDEFLESRKTASTPAEYIPLEKQAEIETLVTGFMRGMIGNAAKIEYSQGLMSMSGDSSSRWGNVPNQGARGLYLPYRHIVRLALTADIASSAFHETYHVVEYQLQTPRERSLMERETPRLRNIVAREKGYSRDQAASISPEEIRAVAFEEYGMARFEGRSVKGLHVGVRGWFEKLFVNLRRLANGLRGLGFETYEDIFGKVYDGGYANAEGKTPRPEAAGDGALAAIHPGRPQPRNVAETIAEKLEKHNLSRLAELSHAVRIGDINLTELREQLQDKFIRIKHAEQSVGKIPSSQSAYHAEELYYGLAGERLEGLEKRHVDPLIHDMKQFDISLEELGAFLYARHAPERNAEVDKINPSLGGEGSGMSDADAARIVDGVMRGPRRNAFLAVEKRVRAIIDDTLSTAVNYGLVSAESAKEWRDRYRNYVPLRGFAEGFDIFGAGDSQSGFDTRKPHSKQALGRKSLADNPLMYVLHQAQSTIINGEKNRVGNGWLAFVQNHPDADRWSVNTPDLKRTINKTTGLVEYRIDNNWYFRKDAFVTRVGGRPQVIRMHGKEGERLASALRNMGTSELNSVLKFMRVLTTTMARLSTAWNPNFIIPNWTRDLGEAFINLNEGQKKDIVKRFSKHIFPSITGSFQALSGQHGGKYAQAFRDFDRAGGRIRFFGLDNIEDINASLAKKLRKLDKGPVANIENAVGNVIDGIEIVSGAIENANRLAAFMAARDVGMSDADAARLARNLTVNFNKHGNLGPVIGALYMFANASIQGTARMARAVRHKGVRRAIYGLMALSALSALYNMAAGGDDEAGENYYARIKPYIRNKNFILMYPKGMGRDGDYVKVPLPYGFSPFAVLGSNLAMFANGKMSAAKATSAVLSSLADAFNPLGEESVAEYLLIPSIFRAGAHINSNKNWTGNPIYPENDYNKHLPDSQKFFKSNSEFSKWVAGGLNSATGGSPYKSGWIDWHPGSVDHVLETVAGGLGKFVVDVVKMGTAAGSGEFDAAKAPVVRRFYGHASDRDADQQTYYERRDEARKSGEKSLKAASNDVHRGINTEIAKGFIEENRRTSVLESIFKSADSVMKPLRAREAQITADESLSVEYKRTEIERIREQMRAIQNRARKQYADKKRELEGKNVQ